MQFSSASCLPLSKKTSSPLLKLYLARILPSSPGLPVNFQTSILYQHLSQPSCMSQTRPPEMSLWILCVQNSFQHKILTPQMRNLPRPPAIQQMMMMTTSTPFTQNFFRKKRVQHTAPVLQLYLTRQQSSSTWSSKNCVSLS